MEGLLHVYTGNGKGKSTAAIGLAVRCAGSGQKVLYTQFLKSDDSCELKVLEDIENICLLRCEKCFGFTFQMTEEVKKAAKIFYTEHFRKVIARIEEYRLLVLDELVTAYGAEVIDRELVLDFLKSRPEGLEIVLTGRGAVPELMEMADYVSEIKKIKHPFDRGVGARMGIEK